MLTPLVLAAALLATPVRVDDAGDPLPEGCVARLGTLRQASSYTYDACFTPDGKAIHTISAHRRLFCEWDPATGALLRNRPVVWVGRETPSFRPDLSAYLVEVPGDRVRLVRTLTGETLSETALPPEAGRYVQAFSPDGKRFALSGYRPPEPPVAGQDSPPADHLVAVCDISGGGAPRLLDGLPGQVNGVSFSADGRRLTAVSQSGEAVEGYGEVSCWDLAAGRLLWRARPKGGQFAATVFAPDGRTLAVRLCGREGHRLELWDAATGRPRPGWTPRVAGDIEPRAFSPDGKLLLYQDPDGLHAAEVPAGRLRYTVPARHGPVVFAPDGASFLTTDPILGRWDTATGRTLWRGTAVRGHDTPVIGLAFSPDGRRLASIDLDDRLFVWDLASRRPRRQPGKFQGPVTFAPDGKALFAAVGAAYTDVPVIALDPETGVILRKFSTAGLFDEPWEPRASGLRAGAAGRLSAVVDLWEDALHQGEVEVVWDARTGAVLNKRDIAGPPARQEKYPSAPLPGGRAEVVLYPDRLVVRDRATGQERLSRGAPSLDGAWTRVVVSPDGTRAATCHPLGTILVWDLGGPGRR
jgi:WD40 repeat protein